MLEQVRGTRPRPRVAIIGKIDEVLQTYFFTLFPTLWFSERLYDLKQQVDYRELDLLIILRGYQYQFDNQLDRENYLNNCHIICYSSSVILPGPLPKTNIDSFQFASTEEYLFPDIPLPENHQREIDFAEVKTIRGFSVIKLHNITSTPGQFPTERETINAKTTKILHDSALALERVNLLPLAVDFARLTDRLRVALLPNPVFSPVWVEILCNLWAESDRKRFPNFGNWQKMPEWMTRQEISLAEEIEKVEVQKEEANRGFALKLAELSAEQISLAESSNKGLRKLITAQGRELVDEVASVFEEFGFGVKILDDDIDPDKSKFEDLRLTIPGENNWEAIVEVRGYSRSSGQTQDFQRLGRFATKFFKEKGKLPEKRILVVNGEIEIINPSNRQLPYSAAKDDLEVFAEDDGLVIWSLDLFRQVNRDSEVSNEEIRKSIMESKGRWRGYQSEPK